MILITLVGVAAGLANAALVHRSMYTSDMGISSTSAAWPAVTPPSCGCPSPATTTTTSTPCTTSATGTATSGTTQTIIVAPTQGILRYVPFVVNASVGDTIEFIWNANNHTVTKSSELAICNKTMDAPFASGGQNKGFIYQQKVNDTNSTYYYCGTPGHCPKGMFGIINPPNAAAGSNTSLSCMMPAMVANSSSMATMWQYTQMITQNNSMAASWGGGIDLSGIPQWAHQYVAQNVMYTRTFLAANPEALNGDGSVSLANAGSTPLMVPVDITSVQNGTAPYQGGNSGSSPAITSSGVSSGNSPSPTTKSGATRAGIPTALSGIAVVIALAFFL